MKLFFILASLLVSFSVQASDRKVGNVIAVEREISNIYKTCLDNLSSDDTGEAKSFFACGIRYLTDGEMAISTGRVLRLKDAQCKVEGFVKNGVLMITFSTTKNTSGFAESRLCLEKATLASNSAKTLVYTVE